MSAAGNDLEKVYVWQWPIRLIHGALVLSIVALSVSGFYIGRPFFEAPGAMGWMRAIHFYASIAFGLALVARVAWMFLGSRWARWDQLVPASRERRRGLWAVIRYYLLPRGAYPHRHPGHNPLAGLSYLGFYLLGFAVAATGLALYSLETASYLSGFRFLVPLFGGAARARWLHHVLMWPVLIFAVVHIYIVTFVARVEGGGIIDSIVTGWKLAHKGKARS